MNSSMEAASGEIQRIVICSEASNYIGSILKTHCS